MLLEGVSEETERRRFPEVYLSRQQDSNLTFQNTRAKIKVKRVRKRKKTQQHQYSLT